MIDMTDTKSEAQLESEHFSPYRPDGKLYGFVCVVTGATEPVGKAIVAELAAHGAACIYALTASSTPESTFSAITSLHPNTKIIPYPYALPTEESTLALLDDVLNAWGRLDIWTCSSSTPSPLGIASTSPSDVLNAFESNAMPAFFALKYAPPAMQKTTPKGSYANAAPKDRAYGSIVIVTSAEGEGVGFSMANCAARGVVRAGVGVLKGTGVRINAIVAGEIEGEEKGRESAVERLGRPEEVARAVGFLASGFSSYVNGSEIRVDGGKGVVGY